MLSRNASKPPLFRMVDMESLVPSDHVLRKIDAVPDLSFVPDAVAACYSAKRGQPSIEPELALRMMLLGVLYDLSDREVVDGTEVRADVSMKSFEPRRPRPPDDPPPPAPRAGKKQKPKPAGDWKGRGKRYKNETHFSPTDPDARLYRKGIHRKARPSYLAHDLIDTKSRVILRRKASLATGTAERDTALEMLDEVIEKKDVWGLRNRPEILTADGRARARQAPAPVLGLQ